jgi:glycine/D-amino acid oxidase-like deaminating enzyme
MHVETTAGRVQEGSGQHEKRSVPMRNRAEIVIIGSGGFGASTAYHLARRSVRDVILLDRYDLGSQTSPRAAGLTSKVAGSELMVKLMDEAVETLAAFEGVTGRSIRFHRVGAMRVLLTDAGDARMRRDAALAQSLGVKVEFLSASEAEGRAPYFRAAGARAILFSPEDGYFHPPLVAREFASAAGEMGVTLAPGTAVTGFVHEGGRVRGVRTTGGVIESPVVVDAAGAWSALLADEVGIRIPMIPTRHQLFITEPIEGIEPHHPIVRIHEPSVYTRPEQGGLMLGGYEDHPLQIDMRKEPASFQVRDLPLDVEVLWGLVDEVAAHFPVLRGAKLREHRGGLPTISPDGEHILGPVATLAGFYIASACNVGGLSISASVGRALADLIVDGASQPDLRSMSVERFRGLELDEAALRAACVHAYARKYTKAQ